jgi:uncharacterized protein YyaL (SSP411 family)
MDHAATNPLRRSSVLTLALAFAAVGAEAGTLEWSASAFETARQQGRPLMVLVTDADHAAAEAAWRAAVGGRLESDFVELRVDRALRPDVAETLGMAVREETGFEGLPLLAAVLPDGTPFLGLAGDRALDPAELPEFADAALAVFRAGAKTNARRDSALGAVRAAQKPSPALRPLDARTVEDATRAAIRAPELGRADGPLPHAALLLLVSEHQRTRQPELLKLATTALDLRLARAAAPPDPPTAELAQALATWTRAHDVAGRASYADEAARVAVRLRARARADRCFPESGTDERVIAQTNGLAIEALALTGRVAGRAEDVATARAAAACVLARLGSAAALSRGDGAPAGSAFLDDHAALLAGLLELYDASGETRWRTEAQTVADAALGRFLDVDGGGFFLTDAAHEPLIARLRHGFDGALPSANGTMARALAHLARATGEPRYAELARRTVDAFLGDLQRAPRALFTLAAAAVEILGPAAAPSSAGAAPSVVTRGPITLHARAPQAPVHAGGRLDLALELSLASGASVVAHGAVAKDLAGFGVSVPFEGSRGTTPRYPPAQPRSFSWNREPVGVYEGVTEMPVSVALARDLPAGPQRVRMRVVFQVCDASGCRPPDSATLEVPVSVEAPR